MSTWYQTSVYGSDIRAVEVEKFTEKTVTLKGGRRHSRKVAWEHYFQRWEDAHLHLLKQTEINVNNAKRRLETAESNLEKVKGLTEPGGA